MTFDNLGGGTLHRVASHAAFVIYLNVKRCVPLVYIILALNTFGGGFSFVYFVATRLILFMKHT